MQKLILLILLAFVSSCASKKSDGLTSFEIYCEMVANDAKPIALHNPMESAEVEQLWDRFKEIAANYGVQLYKEDNFPATLLFASALTENKTVVLIYSGDRLSQYKQWKLDLEESNGTAEELARRFGRLLGYGPHGINQLIGKNSNFRTLASFEVNKQITHLYYENLNQAATFYRDVLGLTMMEESVFQISTDAYIHLHQSNADHPKNQPKSTAIAFLTDQLPGWYTYAQKMEIPIKYTYKPREGGPHDGFVAIDPGGYLLEFEQFKQHPENELFIAKLAAAAPVKTAIEDMDFYGSITWTYHKDLLLMQKFYEEVLGYQLVADQGWTKIYQTSQTGFIGLVDERRGMEDFAEKKAVEIEWTISEGSVFDSYANDKWELYQYKDFSFTGPEMYRYQITEQ